MKRVENPFQFLMVLQILFIVFVIGIVYWLITSGTKVKNFHTSSRIYISSIEKYLSLSPHAYQRLQERGITFKELKDLLEDENSQAKLQKNGRIRITNGTITAILGTDGDNLILVTAFKNS